MFDIGFAELIIIAVVGLLVIGPERLPAAIRTATVYLNRIRRSFNDIKREVQQELHNDEVMRDLRRTGEQLKHETEAIGRDVENTAARVEDKPDTPAAGDTAAAAGDESPDGENNDGAGSADKRTQ